MIVFVPVTLFIVVFAKPLMGFASNGEIADVSGAVAVGALSIFFFGLAYIFSQICIAMDKKLYILAVHTIAFVVHLVVLLVGVKSCKNPATAIGVAMLLASVIMVAAYGVLMTMQLDYKHNMLNLVKPLISGAVSAGIGLLIVLLLGGKSADLLLLLIGAVIFIVIYMIVLAALHGITKKELSRLPGGEFLIRLFWYR
jgi:stage V sporulation protein B